MAAAALASMALAGGGAILAAGPVRPEVRRTTEDPVTAVDQLYQAANNSPMLAADPTEGRFVALASRMDSPDYDCALNVSGDGGRSWIPTQVMDRLPEGVDKCYGPEVAFDASGRLYFLFVGLAGNGNRPVGAFLTASVDRGRTFAVPRRVLGPLNFGVRLAVDASSGRVHLVWLHAASEVQLGGFGQPPNPILAAHSDDGGRTFSPPVEVAGARGELVLAPALVVGPGHRVHVAYFDLGRDLVDYYGVAGGVWNGTWSVGVATSGDGGRTFARGEIVDAGVETVDRVSAAFIMPPPSVAAGPGQRVCVAWTDARYGDRDAMLRCARRPGRWEPLRRLNEDGRGNGRHQFLPRLAVAPGGRLDVVYLDRRADPLNAHNQTSYTFSTDGGRTFVRTRQLSTRASDGNVGQRFAVPGAEGQHEFGARLGLLSRRDGAVAAWPDTRHSRGVAREQEVVAGVVELTEPRPPLVAWALVMAGAGGLMLALTRPKRPSSPAAVDAAGPTTSRSASRRRRVVVPVVAVSLLAGLVAVDRATGHSRRGPSAGPPPAPSRVAVTMEEYRYRYEQPRRPGRVVFDVRNAGREDHEMLFFLLSDDFPPINEQLTGTTRRVASPYARLARLHPGETTEFAMDLVANQRYAIVCYVMGPDEEIHGIHGMNGEIVIRSNAPKPGGGPPPPPAGAARSPSTAGAGP